MSAGVTITLPTGNNLKNYVPTTSGGITSLILSKYIKNINFYEYMFAFVLDATHSCAITKFPDDDGNIINSFQVMSLGTNSTYTDNQFSIVGNQIRLQLTPSPGASRTLFVRVVVGK